MSAFVSPVTPQQQLSMDSIQQMISNTQQQATMTPISIHSAARMQTLDQIPGQTQTPVPVQAVQSTRPSYFIPYPQVGIEPVPSPIVNAFDKSGDNQLKWFATPPIDVVSSSKPALHTLDYLYEKAQRKQAAMVSSTAHVGVESQSNSVTRMDVDKIRVDSLHKPDQVVDHADSTRQVLDALTAAWLEDANALKGR
ncbi:hypothetical protein BDV3_002155 [Batrachochytrium dendrobatidis]